jgi:hypothetical protein
VKSANDPERVISYRYDAFGRQVEVSDDAFDDAVHPGHDPHDLRLRRR